MSARTASLAMTLLAAGCTGSIFGSPPPTSPTADGPDGGELCGPPPGSNSLTEQVRRGLAPTCAGCHSVGQSGFFASATAFESLLVRNARLIKPGKPDESELIQLLEGRRRGSSMTQMPLSGEPFAQLDKAGQTSIHLQQVKDWIVTLQPPGVVREPARNVAAVQRIDATYLELGLRDLLGLSESDFYGPASEHGVFTLYERSDDNFDVRSPDRAPRQWASRGRYVALGGAAASISAFEDQSISTSFAQTLVPLSQSWCGLAVRKQGNAALFTVATGATGSADPRKLRQQLADWHLLFLGERASAAQVDAVVTRVFAPIETASGIETAWIGTCSYFIRHPLFIFY